MISHKHVIHNNKYLLR